MDYECMLTTFDNPFDPFEDIVAWNLYDIEKGYNTCQYLARISEVTDDMSTIEIERENERAMDEIILHDFMNIYKKVMRTKVNA